jgi:hypothetical protein
MQRVKDKKPARGCTAAEFQFVAKHFMDEARQKFHAASFKCKPLLSMDNDKIHTSAKLAAVGISKESLVELPPYSPDLHRVIERVHARICTELRKRIHYDSSVRTAKQYADLLEKIFHETQTQAVIAKDVEGLPHLWQHVAKSGEYAPASLS